MKGSPCLTPPKIVITASEPYSISMFYVNKKDKKKVDGRSHKLVNYDSIPGRKINIRISFLHSSDCGVLFLSFKSSSIVYCVTNKNHSFLTIL